MKKSLFLLPLAAFMLAGCGGNDNPTPPTHTHSLSGWVSDANNHWKTCSECNAVVDKAAHADGNSDGKCDVCNYQMSVHTHSWSDWKSNETNHWKECSCGEKSEPGAHVDADNNEACDVCGYPMPKPVPAGNVVLDFTSSIWKDQKITPYVSDNTTLMQFTYDGITYNDAGCYANTFNNVYWLMMKNKWEDGKVAEGEASAFIGNAVSYGKVIDKVVVTTSTQGGAVDFYVNFGSTAFEAGSRTGTKKSVDPSTEVTFTATNTGNAEFFSLTAAKDVGQYRKNGGIAKIEISFK